MTITDDFSYHRLTDHTQLKEYYTQKFATAKGEIDFWQYSERLYRKLIKMQPGESFMIDHLCVEENRDMFIKILCSFIAGDHLQGYMFNARYTMFRRLEQPIIYNSIIINNKTFRITSL